MKVRLLKEMPHPIKSRGNYPVGTMIDVIDSHGRRMVESGEAEALEQVPWDIDREAAHKLINNDEEE